MKKLLTFVLLALTLSTALAQNAADPVIFEINGKKIYQSEFMREFLRSIGKDPKAAPTACTYEKRQALEEYVQLFVNYRTKLEDAYANGYDTIPSMLRELEGYRKELAAPYLIDSVTLENVLREAYDRNRYVLSAAHIFVSLPYSAMPEDTLKAYNEIMRYYNSLCNKEDFFSLARMASAEMARKQGLPKDDPRSKDDGRLGNFTVFEMVYPFETAAYSLNVGEYSKPVRTNFGYHIIKLLAKVPYFSKCTFQHIWISEKAEDTIAAKTRINKAYKLLNEGYTFEEVCRNYSEDNSTNENGGLLVDMAVRQVPPEYVGPLATLKEGDVSEPFKTRYGWHIVKLVKRDSLPSFEEMVPYYKQRMTQDSRSNMPREAFVDQCKQRYNFVDFTKSWELKSVKGKKTKVFMASLDECRAALSDSLFIKAWHYDDSMVTDMRPLFKVADKYYTAVDLLRFIESHQRAEARKDKDAYLDDRYNNFINDKVFEYADSHLETDHPEFGELMTEYRNGLMIFSYNDANVWSKAIKDTAGLSAFYAANVDKHSIDNEEDAPYFMGESVDMKIFRVADSAWLKPDKALSIVSKLSKKGVTNAEIVSKLNKAIKADSVSVQYDAKVVEVERQNILSKEHLRQGIYVLPLGHGYQIVRVDAMLNPRVKTLLEARGFYINDYQNYLEEQLINTLRKKYNVIIHQNVIDEIVY